MTAEVILLNPSYIYPPFGPGLKGALYLDPLVMDLATTEFLYPPIGLLTIGGALKRAGYRVQGIDSNTERLTMEELAEKCEGAKVVGICLLSANLRSVYRLCQLMQGRGYEVVVGGAYPSIDPQVVAKLGLRYGITGEGEVAFTRLCDALIRGEGKPEDIPGIIIADGDDEDKEVYVKPPELLPNLDEWLPDRELMRFEQYKLPFVGRMEVALAIRGCPYKCTFCYCSSPSPNAMFNKVRTTSVDVIVKDIAETWRKYKPNYLEMIDETFTVNRPYVMDICQGLIDEKLDMKWGAKTRIDLMDDELMDMMKRAGLQKIGFGVESGVYDHRKAMMKDFPNSRVKATFDTARRLGVESACTIIFGHPDETRADMQQSVDFAKEIRADYVEFHIMVLVPETQLFYRAVREGKTTVDVWDRFMRGEITYPEYSPGDFMPEEMRDVHQDAIRQFYFRPKYIAQAVRRLKNPAQLVQYAKTAASLVNFSGLKQPVWRVGRSRA